MAILEVSGFKKSFGNVNVLKGINFSLEEGEVLAIIGPSGGGKTTLLKLIMGQLEPDSGTIETGETVPIKFTGTIAYSLCYDETRQNSPFYGITITTENSKTYTKVFSYSPKNNSTTSLFKLQDEDPDAYTLLKYPALFTNIGKTTVRYYDISSKKTTQFKRSASMPLKADSTSNMVAIVNRDGSISWYKMNSSTVLADWYLTTDGNWISY